ncbi:MAG: transposase [Chloroflexi bacterium]|nr:transposase [Chloroflexota bacterium]
MGDGALGFWAALRKVYPDTREQRCWIRAATSSASCPGASSHRAKDDLHQIWMAETRQDAEAAFDLFLEKYGAKYPKQPSAWKKDRAALLAFYDFPADVETAHHQPHRVHTFATVRLRHRRRRDACRWSTSS